MSSLIITEIAIIAALLWIGFVSAISFMEAWLKFRAPGVTIELGLGIGQIIFRALNRVELFLALIIGASILSLASGFSSTETNTYLIALALLLLQTFWLLPVLDQRIKARLKNIPVPKSNKHFIYIGAELIKVVALSICVIHLLISLH